jgi:hypothetical protein
VYSMALIVLHSVVFVCILKNKLHINFVAGGAQMELLLTRITW